MKVTRFGTEPFGIIDCNGQYTVELRGKTPKDSLAFLLTEEGIEKIKQDRVNRKHRDDTEKQARYIDGPTLLKMMTESDGEYIGTFAS